MIIVAIYVDLLRSRYHVQMGALHPLANEFLSASFSLISPGPYGSGEFAFCRCGAMLPASCEAMIVLSNKCLR